MMTYTVPRIIGLAGYAGSGKDTVAAQMVRSHGYTRLAFADALKDVLKDVDPIITYDGREWRPSNFPHGVEDAKKHPEGRRLLQALGDSIRQRIAVDVWEGIVAAKARTILGDGGKVVVSDVRYRNEAAMIRSLGGEVWYVARHGHGPANDHVSEVGITPGMCERVVPNGDTVDGLAVVVDWMMTAGSVDDEGDD